ncbi:MAG: tetratricopeptide repeat protein [Myxococcota bacterium]
MARPRFRRALSAVLASATVVAVGAGFFLYQASAGEDAVRLAAASLETPFLHAPELHELAIEEAATALERAQDLGASVEPSLQKEVEAFEYWAAGDLIFAEGALGEARQGDGWTTRRRLLAAAIARAAGRVDEASDHAAEAVAGAPDDPRALLMMADLALDAGDGQAARTALEHLEDAERSLPTVQNRIGLAYEVLGDADAAEQAFRSAIDRAPELFEAHINLGRTLRARGDVRGAQGAFQTAVGLSPADADGHLGLGLVTGGDEGAQHLQRAAELAPYEDAALLALGDIHAAEGRYDEAVETYREALRRSGRNAAGYVKLGNALVRTRSDADAQVAFNAAIALDEDLAPAHNGLGTCLAALGQVEDAQASFERAAALDDSDPHPLMNLAVLHARHGDRREAEARWADAQSRRPGLGPLPR